MFFGLLLTFLRTLYGFLRTKVQLFPNFLYFSHNWVVLLQNLPITTITCSTLSLDFTQLLQLLNMIGNSIFCNMAFCSKFLAGNLWVIFYE